MKNTLQLLILLVCSLLTFSCDSPKSTNSSTTVNVVSYSFDADDFDLASVVAKLQTGKMNDVKELQDFINTTDGINNVDIDKDGNTDTIYVTEEVKDGSQVLIAKAHPLTGEPVVVMEVSFTKTTSGDVEMQAAYPDYVSNSAGHYYSHTLTGSVLGDMMFYRYLFAPHPMFMPMYGAYGYGSRAVMPQSQVSSTRTTYRSTNNVVSPTPKAKPSTYSPKSETTKVANKSFQQRSSGGTLSSKSGNSTFTNRGSSTPKPQGNSFKSSSPSVPKSGGSSWGSSRSSSGGFRSGGSSRSKSSYEYKHDIQYLTEAEVVQTANEVYSLPLATWYYNEGESDDTERQHLGIIVEDAQGAAHAENLVSEDSVDLYGYTSMAILAIQHQHSEIEALRREVESLRQGICQ